MDEEEWVYAWGGVEDGMSYNNYLKLTTLQLQSIVYGNDGKKFATFTCKKG